MNKFFSVFMPKPKEEPYPVKRQRPVGQMVINPDNFIGLMIQRGWCDRKDGHEPVPNFSKAAEALGLTRQRISQIMQGEPVSGQFMASLAMVTGTSLDKTYTFYFEVQALDIPDNHPCWNEEKYKGNIPYVQYSTSAKLRAQDRRVETSSR